MVRVGSGEFWTARSLHPDEKDRAGHQSEGARHRRAYRPGRFRGEGGKGHDRPHRVGGVGASRLSGGREGRQDHPPEQGCYSATLTVTTPPPPSGLTLVVPIMDRMLPKTDLREQVVAFQPQAVITSDNVGMQILIRRLLPGRGRAGRRILRSQTSTWRWSRSPRQPYGTSSVTSSWTRP